MSKQQYSKIYQSMKYHKPFTWITFYQTFTKWYHFLKKTQTWNQERIKQYQQNQLQSLLKHSYDHVPYYNKLLKSNNIKPSDIKTLSDLSKIPILTKEHIRKNTEQFKATNYAKTAFQKRNTGGTTGKPLQFYLEKAAWLGIHFAYNKIYMQQADYKWKDKVVSIAGINQRRKYHPFLRTLELSSFHSTSKDLSYYHQQIKKFKPKYITAFPSALMLLTNHIQNSNKTMYPNLKAIFCHGERLDYWQKKYFEHTYKCNVFDQYGHREQCVFATTCNESNMYHIYPTYGIVEILDKNNEPVKAEEEQGEIIATSLTNKIFPFIRYRTEDLAIVTTKKCSCENNYPLIKKIHGRTQEYLISKTNETIPLTGLYHMIAEEVDHVKECQLYQETAGELIVYYVEDEQFTEKNLKQIEKVFQTKLGSMLTITYEPVVEIKRTKDGKYQYLIQKLQIKNHD